RLTRLLLAAGRPGGHARGPAPGERPLGGHAARAAAARGPPGALMPTLTPAFPDFLPEWVARQRWYTAKGRTPLLRRVGGLRHQDPDGEVGVETWLVQDDGGPSPVVYQVPLTYRGAPVPELEHALVAQAEHSELGPRWIYDG